MLSKEDYKKMVERTLSLTDDEKLQIREFVERAYRGDKASISSLETFFDIKFSTFGDIYTLANFVFKKTGAAARAHELNTLNQRLELRTTKPPMDANKITIKRMDAGLTQTQLANAIGVGQKDISRWETGVRNPKTDNLKKIADVLNCKIDDLI